MTFVDIITASLGYRIAVVCAPASALCFASKHPRGRLAMRMRHLRLLSYRVILVREATMLLHQKTWNSVNFSSLEQVVKKNLKTKQDTGDIPGPRVYTPNHIKCVSAEKTPLSLQLVQRPSPDPEGSCP